MMNPTLCRPRVSGGVRNMNRAQCWRLAANFHSCDVCLLKRDGVSDVLERHLVGMLSDGTPAQRPIACTRRGTAAKRVFHFGAGCSRRLASVGCGSENRRCCLERRA
jgi:hypothetical protein